jgi:DNA-binding response OmpR family regulator
LVAAGQKDDANDWGRSLEAAGYDVRVLYNGRDALVSALIDPPDVAVLDTDLARLDGWMVARRIRAGSGGHRRLLIAVSKPAEVIGQWLSREAGFNLHLTRPLDPAVLVRILRRYEPPTRTAP